MKTVLFLVILGLHPADGTAISAVQGPYTTEAACQKAWVDFKAEALKAEMPQDAFKAVCFVWQQKAYTPAPDSKKETTL